MSMTSTNASGEMSSAPGARSVPFVAGDTPAMPEWADQPHRACSGGDLEHACRSERIGDGSKVRVNEGNGTHRPARRTECALGPPQNAYFTTMMPGVPERRLCARSVG